jgi:hypothetical protein
MDASSFRVPSEAKVIIMKALLTAAFATLVIGAATLPASAGCGGCYVPPPQPQYRQVVTPPQYRVVQRTVLVAPARVIWHRIPAQYGTVQQTVQVAPERVGYSQVCGACGVSYRPYTIPAQYGTVERTVMVAPSRAVAETIPAQYGVVERTVMVAPAQAYLVPVNRCNACGY